MYSAHVLTVAVKENHDSNGNGNVAKKRFKALAKLWQHFNVTDRKIVGHNMLLALSHPVTMCDDML